LVIDDRMHGVRARLAGGTIHLSTSADPPGSCGRVLPWALAPPLLDAGVALLHAAVVVDGGRAVLVTGPTGSGKSTSVAAARAAGLRIAGDDLALVWEADGRWQVQGLARPVRMPPDLAPGAEPVPDDPRRRVTPTGWVDGSTAELVGTVLVGHGDDGALRAADAVTATRAILASSFATVLPRCVAPSLTRARRLSELPRWHLDLAADLEVRISTAGTHLRSALA
ncbi:MAG: hypothetical protein ACTHN0_12005, partial [Aquihabitans sp.]